jgi:hypothetical protein
MEEDKSTAITVMGLGVASAKPDQAELRLGVSTKAATASEALTKNAESVNQIREKIKSLGVSETEIETARFFLRPSYSRMEERLEGFMIDHILGIIVPDLDRVGEIIDKAVEAGANRVDMIMFTFRKDTVEELKKQARRNALTDVKARAETIAESLGVKIVGITVAVEDAYPYMEDVRMRGLAATGTPITPPTEREMGVAVRVTFKTEQKT